MCRLASAGRLVSVGRKLSDGLRWADWSPMGRPVSEAYPTVYKVQVVRGLGRWPMRKEADAVASSKTNKRKRNWDHNPK